MGGRGGEGEAATFASSPRLYCTQQESRARNLPMNEQRDKQEIFSGSIRQTGPVKWKLGWVTRPGNIPVSPGYSISFFFLVRFDSINLVFYFSSVIYEIWFVYGLII